MENNFSKSNYVEFEAHIENVIMRLGINLTYKFKSGDELENPVLHDHSFSEVFACLEGSFTVRFDDHDVVLQENDAIIIPPGLNHIKISQKNTLDCTVSFNCIKNSIKNCADVYSILSQFHSGSNYSICKNNPEFCQRVLQIAKSPSLDSPFVNAIDFTQALIKSAPQFTLKSQRVAGGVKSNKINNDIPQMMLLDELLCNYSNYNLDLNGIAKKLFISRRQLDRISVKRFGKPLYSVMLDKRITAAEKLLQTTNLTIEAVAFQTGFNSTVGLYREFKKRYNLTPQQFRNIKK